MKYNPLVIQQLDAEINKRFFEEASHMIDEVIPPDSYSVKKIHQDAVKKIYARITQEVMAKYNQKD